MTHTRDPLIRDLIAELADSSPEAPNFVEIEDLASEPVGMRQVHPLRSVTPEATHGWRAALTTGAAVILLLGGAALLFGGNEAGNVDIGLSPSTSNALTPAISATTSLPPSSTTEPDRSDQAVFGLSTKIDLGAGYLPDVAVTPGWVWAAVEDAGLHRIDPLTGSIDTTIRLPSIGSANIEVGDNSLWIAHGAAITRIDPETAEVTGSVEVEWSSNHRTRPLAVGFGSVWVASETGVHRLDEATIEQTGDLPLPAPPSGLVTGAGFVWALVAQDGVDYVFRIDPTTFGIEAAIPIQGSVFHPSFGTPLVYGQDAIWINAGGLTRLDPTTKQVSIVLNDPNCCGPTAVGFTRDRIIAAGLLDDTIVIVDPDSGELEPVSDFRFDMGVFAIAGDDEGFWAAETRKGILYRFDMSAEQP